MNKRLDEKCSAVNLQEGLQWVPYLERERLLLSMIKEKLMVNLSFCLAYANTQGEKGWGGGGALLTH